MFSRVIGFIQLAVFCLPAALPGEAQGERADDVSVTLSDEGRTYLLANGFVTARINKGSGDIVSLRYNGLELLGSASGHPFGYWSHVGGGSLGRERQAAVLVNPSENSGERVIVSIKALYDGQSGTLPVDVDMRYALGRGDQGIYTYAIWRHEPDYPAFSIAEARFGLKLNEKVFDYMTIDEKRRKVMPAPADWDNGTQLNMKEVRRLNTGRHAGHVEHKYAYSAVQFEIPAHGWSSTGQGVGLWIINPTIEYLSGGPTKVELTGHLDVNRGAAPTLLNYWKGSHYGGSALVVAQDEAWTKFIGPMLIYCSSGGDHGGMWKDALAQAGREAEKWPYHWANDPQYPSREERGAVTGRIVLNDPWVSQAQISNLLVGLAAPAYTVASGRGGRATVDWQRDARYYQFWVRADEEGRFLIPNVRPGSYTLYAIADGVLGEFSFADVTIRSGERKSLGALEWIPVRHGRQVWEIGIPNRSAEEFRHGDHYWQWGLYHRYAEEFPNGLNFVVGESDWRTDWNYAQPARSMEGRREVEATTWSIGFEMPEAPHGNATLRLAIAGNRTPRGVLVSVNGTPVGGTGPLPDSGVMHRDGIRGYWCEREVRFDAVLLAAGPNVIELHVPATSWVHGVLYDYLRLELDDSSAGTASGR